MEIKAMTFIQKNGKFGKFNCKNRMIKKVFD